MPIDPLPSISRSDANFRTQVDDYFLTRLPAFSTQAELARVQIVAAESAAATAASTATAAASGASTSASSANTSANTAVTARDDAVAARIAAELAAAAAATFDPAAYVPKAGATMTGHLTVPAGASGSQVPRASEVVLQSQLQTSAADAEAGKVLKTGSFGIGGGAISSVLSADGMSVGGFFAVNAVTLAAVTAGAMPPVSVVPAWFNITTAGAASRQSQFAHQVYNNIAYTQGLWTRTKHDSLWSPWRRIAEHEEQTVIIASGVMDCRLGRYFAADVNGNTTLSFLNIPEMTYECVLEIHHGSGTITMPTGTVWCGTPPTLAIGKRHLVWFRRARLGTAGWFASALAGYSQ